MELGYEYWNVLYEYIKEKEELNGEIKHDARIIKHAQFLWKNASKKYINKLDKKDLMDLWCDIDNLSKNQSYETLYKEFVEYLYYASDRMNLNRWSYLQLCIGKAADLIYAKYCDIYKYAPWSETICDGYVYNSDYTSWKTNLELLCEKEWKNLIKKENKNQK